MESMGNPRSHVFCAKPDIVKGNVLKVSIRKQSVLVQAKAAANVTSQTVPSRLAVIVDFK
jgi:hypothetical protein